MYTAIIVDDEKKARDLMETLIGEFCPDINIIGKAEDVQSAVKMIKLQSPDLVFLDIEMPGYSGFQLLDFFDQIPFDIIFTTAYREYALNAFEVSAIDYLLKPIQIKQLTKAVEKFKQRRNASSSTNDRIQTLKANLNPEETIRRIAVPVNDGFEFLDTQEIIYLSAERSYTHVFMANGSKFLFSKNLKEFVDTLVQPWFFKPHRSYLINLNRVSRYVKKDGGYIIMENGDQVSISRDRKEAFFLVYQKIS